MSAPLTPPRRWSVRSPLPLWAKVFLWTVFLGALFGYAQLHALGRLRSDWIAAYHARDVAALEALVCWEGVSAEQRQRMRLLLAQELEHPIRSSDVRLSFDAAAEPGWRPNRFVVGRLVLVYDTPEHLTVSFPVGFEGLWTHRLVMMVPER